MASPMELSGGTPEKTLPARRSVVHNGSSMPAWPEVRNEVIVLWIETKG
jgi:hypothetical protein